MRAPAGEVSISTGRERPRCGARAGPVGRDERRGSRSSARTPVPVRVVEAGRRPAVALQRGRRRSRRRRGRRRGSGRSPRASASSVATTLGRAVGVARSRAGRAARAGRRRCCGARRRSRAGRGTSRRRAIAPMAFSPVAQQRGDVVGLVAQPVAVAGPAGREHVVADARAVELELVDAERGHVQPRPLTGRRAPRTRAEVGSRLVERFLRPTSARRAVRTSRRAPAGRPRQAALAPGRGAPAASPHAHAHGDPLARAERRGGQSRARARPTRPRIDAGAVAGDRRLDLVRGLPPAARRPSPTRHERRGRASPMPRARAAVLGTKVGDSG